jgi:hypothetical protein
MPYTNPVVRPTTATDGVLLVHTPPGMASAKGVVPPTHTVSVPVICACACCEERSVNSNGKIYSIAFFIWGRLSYENTKCITHTEIIIKNHPSKMQ